MKNHEKNKQIIIKEAFPIELFNNEINLDKKTEKLLIYKEIGILAFLILFIIVKLNFQ